MSHWSRSPMHVGTSSSSSYKAAHRPGEMPSNLGSSSLHGSTLTGSSLAPAPVLKRTNSIVSLPSPPDELPDGRLPPAVVYFSDEDLDDTDLEADDDRDHDGTDHEHASNRMLVDCNPFLIPSTSSLAAEKQARIEARPDHPQASPTHQARRKRIDKDKIKLGDGGARKPCIGPKSMGRGWDSPSNPFIAREGESVEPARRENRKPDKVTYVFRGKRVTYDIPLEALLAPEDPEDSPFPDPSPRLLFPTGPDPTSGLNSDNPITPPSHSRPTSSFLDALRATTAESGKPKSNSSSMGLPPTPVTERQHCKGRETSSVVSRGEARYGPYKRMAEAMTMDDPEKGRLR